MATIFGTTNDDILTGTGQDELLQGLDGNDSLSGLGGNDTLDGGSGADILDGGDGNDVLVYDAADVSVSGGAGIDTLDASAQTTDVGIFMADFPDIESAVGGSGNDMLVGTSGDNVLAGGAGNDFLWGKGGNDTLIGGAGADRYVYGAGEGNVVIAADAANSEDSVSFYNAVQSQLTFTLNGNDLVVGVQGATGSLTVKDWTLSAGNGIGKFGTSDMAFTPVMGSNGNDSLTGTAGIDVMYGFGGNNVIDGGAGMDYLYGGDGNDVLVYDAADAAISGGAGVDTLDASAQTNDVGIFMSDFPDIENAIGGSGNDVLAGTGIDNVLTGGAGNDFLWGKGGNDTLIGGAGADRYVYGAGEGNVVIAADAANSEDSVSFYNAVQSQLTFTLNGNDLVVGIQGATGSLTVKDWTLSAGNQIGKFGTSDMAFTPVMGSNGNDSMAGTAGIDVMYGFGGNDVIDGGAGMDYLYGGDGNDVLVYDAADAVISGGAGVDTLDASAQTSDVGIFMADFLDIENAVGGSGNNVLAGTGSDNVLSGGVGNDFLWGKGGNDTLIGGEGADRYVYGAGEGNVVIAADAANSEDSVSFYNAVQSQLTFTLNGNDLVVGIQGSTGSLTVKDWTLSAGNGIGKFGTSDMAFTPVMGSNGNDSLAGTTGIDVMHGFGGNDVIDGGAGMDYLYGGDGNDVLVYDAADAVISGSAGVDTLDASAQTSDVGIFMADFPDIENAIGGSGNDVLAGTGSDNVLAGGAGNDFLWGKGGNDTLIGGAGADQYFYGAGEGDVVIAADATNSEDTVSFYNALQSQLSFNLSGNDLVVTIQGSTGSLTVKDWALGAGNRIGFIGASDGPVAVDTIFPVMGIQGTEGNDTLTGTSDNDVMYGYGGNDTLSGGAGADTMYGGLGNDNYAVDNAGDLALEAAGAGVDTVSSSVTYTLGDNIENLTLTGASTIDGTGNNLANVITGNSAYNILYGLDGDDTINGGAGIDTMYGGAGNDVYYADNTMGGYANSQFIGTDLIVENANEGIDTLNYTPLGTYTLGANIENLVVGNTSGAAISGNELDNVMTGGSGIQYFIGGAGNDTLMGGGGSDTLDGGAGADVMVGGISAGYMTTTYVVDNVGDVIIEEDADPATPGGYGSTDTVLASIDYTLGAHLENLVLTGNAVSGGGNSFANTLTGNALANTLYGYDGNDTLNGGAGADILIGGLGNDVYTVDDIGDVIIENLDEGTDAVSSSVSYTLSANVESLSLTGSIAINGTGNELDNFITGNTGSNILSGGFGNDTLNGGTGADTLFGGLGNDSFVVDNVGDLVMEYADEGIDTVQSSVTYTLGTNIENLTLTGSAAINGTGNDLSNILTGNSGVNKLDGGLGDDTLLGGTGNDNLLGGLGNDWLEGGAGNDTMIGGAGDDTYVVDSSTDTIVELAGEGIDTVRTGLTYTLGTELENLTLTGTSAVNGTGNSLDNVIIGNSAANILLGGAGNDWLTGGAGADTYRFLTGFGHDTITGAADNNLDKIDFSGFTSASAAILLGGSSGNDLIITIGSDSVTVADWNLDTGHRLNTFTFSDGTKTTNGSGWL